MATFRSFTEAELQLYLKQRPGELKLGERIQIGRIPENSDAQFVIIGLPEDLGVRANLGIAGAATAWPSFLHSFLNLQENAFLSGVHFLLWGYLDCSDWMAQSADIPTLRTFTERIDDWVFPLIQQIVSAGKIPLVIGGGHNNAYPLIKGTALALRKGINAINLDAHADFRALEGRHSGNGFTYAYKEEYLKNYALLGLHENYNSEAIRSELQENKDFLSVYWEDIFMREELTWTKALDLCLQKIKHQPVGVELDLDCIEGVLSSAATPVGISTRHALTYLYQCGLQPNSYYVHLPEGITQRADGCYDPSTGKLLSYLVQAFCKGVLERHKERSPAPLL